MYEGVREDEYFKPLIHQGIKVDGYFVSNYGTVIGKKGFPLKHNTNNNGNYPCVKVMVPAKDFPHYKDEGRLVNSRGIMAKVHVLVADAHLPFEDNLPPIWEEYIEVDGRPMRLWDLMTKEQQATLRSAYQVDHINGIKTDPSKGNLRYLVGRDNTHAYHYESSPK